MAELADALDLGSSGRPWGFKSLYPHQKGGGSLEPPPFWYDKVSKGLERVGIGNLQVWVFNIVADKQLIIVCHSGVIANFVCKASPFVLLP